MKHTFKKPFNFEGTEYKELNFDFDRLSGEDLVSVERELVATGSIVINMQTSQTACMLVAAKAAKVPFELIKALPINEASAVALLAQHFLLGVE